MKVNLGLRINLLLTDLGFLTYWFITAIGVLPESWLFNGYNDPIMKAWNWSFLPLDVIASMLGLISLYLAKRDSLHWRSIAVISLSLTSAAGLVAITFFGIRLDFQAQWWLPNLYLVFWPIFYLYHLLCEQFLYLLKVPSEPVADAEEPPAMEIDSYAH